MKPLQKIKLFAENVSNKPMTIGSALEVMEDAGFSLLCVLFALPFLQPVPLGPFAIAAGITYTALGWQMMQGRHTPWLPQKMLNVSLQKKNWDRIIWLCSKLTAIIESISKPRLSSWVNTPQARKRLGALICISGLLMSIPMFAVPFNNTLPALVVLSAAIGEIEDDGMWVIISIFFLGTTVAYFSAIGWALLTAGYYFVG